MMMSKIRKIPSPQEAASELARRELAKSELIYFAKYMYPRYQQTRHLRYVAKKLERVELYVRTKGEEGIGRLMIFMPPRTGKTELTAKMFSAWFLGRNPDKRVILSAYGASLAEDSSRAVRNYVMDTRFQAIFGKLDTLDDPVMLSEDSRSVSRWDLAAPYRGGLLAAGVGGAITGKGADLLIVDDPYKSREEAQRDSYRESVDSWWQSAAYTRLEDGAAIVIVHTRWHPDDLAGALLKRSVSDPLADDYEVVFLPAIALEEESYPTNEEAFKDNLSKGLYLPYKDQIGRMPGDPLWPEKYNANDLEKIQVNVGDFEFASLYQQLPRPMTGNFFDAEMFKVVARKDVPTGLKWVRYNDLAMGETERSDWNVSLAAAMDEATGDLYYRDMLRVHDINKFMVELKRVMLLPEEKGVRHGFESNGFQSLVLKEFIKDHELATVPMQSIKVEKDKVTRATPIRTRGTQGKVFLVDGPWVKGFQAEALNFPNGKHDDQVDSASGGLEMVANPLPTGRALIAVA